MAPSIPMLQDRQFGAERTRLLTIAREANIRQLTMARRDTSITAVTLILNARDLHYRYVTLEHYLEHCSEIKLVRLLNLSRGKFCLFYNCDIGSLARQHFK